MVRFKQFMGRGHELEHAVNAWLMEFNPDVTQMAQTVNQDGTVCLAILFEESFRGQELRLSSERTRRVADAPISTSSVPDRPIRVPIEPGTERDEPAEPAL